MPEPYYNAHEVAASLLRPGRSMLDAGCGSGRFTRMAQQLGCPVTAMDVDESHVATLAQEGHCALRLDLEDPDWAAGLEHQTFDQVVALDVLEHLRDPLGALLTLKKLVAPDGQLILSLPNVTHLDVRIALLAGRFTYTDDGILDRTHLRFFDRSGLEELLDAAGLDDREVIEIRRDGRDDALAGGVAPELVAALAQAGSPDVQQWVVHCSLGEPMREPGLLRRMMLDSLARGRELAAAGEYARSLEAQLAQSAAQDQRVVELTDAVRLAREELATKSEAIAAGGAYVGQLLDELATVREELADARLLVREVESQRELIGALSAAADRSDIAFSELEANYRSLEDSYRRLEAHHHSVVADQRAQLDALASQHGQDLAAQAARNEELRAQLDAAQERASQLAQDLALATAGMGYRLIQPGTRLLARHRTITGPLRPVAREILRRTGG